MPYFDYGSNSSSQDTNYNTPSKGAPGWLRYLLPSVGQGVGEWGGGVAGAAGGALIPGADLTGVPEVAGALAGKTAGGAGGSALGTWIFNQIDRSMGGQGNDSVGQSALTGAIAVPGSKALSKGAGYALHPIQRNTSKLVNILNTSKKTVDIQPALEQYVANSNAYTKGGLDSATSHMHNTVVPDIIAAVKSLQKEPLTANESPFHTSNPVNFTPSPVNSNTLYRDARTATGNVKFKAGGANSPIPPTEQYNGPLFNPAENVGQQGANIGFQLPLKDAYYLKANQQGIAQGMGAYDLQNPLVNSQQAIQGQQRANMARAIGQQVHTASPDVAAQDAALSKWHKREQLADPFLKSLPFGLSKPTRFVAGLPLATVQKAFPVKGDGKFNKILPYILNAGGTYNRSINSGIDANGGTGNGYFNY